MKMTVVVENHKMNEVRDKFPIGMRVLAVDDDRTCLKILERLLLRCQYHVTTAQNAITALNLLRKNKNNFDLVISNVHMPDMDGFKLLELVGLEMDLPVIMFSANDDQKMVMKGIEHGACDYLVKPVRLKELQIIWQHVIRKKKTSKTANHDTPKSDSGNGIDSAVTANSDQNEKSYRKRKEHNEDDSEENEDDNDSEDPTARKKARVVWAPDLHRKFIAAVNHLGFDKAVPKKILDLMNDETLTRENVASHLQKYRLYLKKVSAENQQAHMIEALGNSAFGSHSGVGGHWQTMNDSTQFHNNPFRSSPSSSMSSRFNTPTNVNIHGLPSSGTLQLNQTLNLNKSTNDQFKFQSALTRGNPIDVQRMPISTGLDQFQYNRGINVSPIQNLTNKPKVTMSFTPSSVLDISNNPMLLEPNSQNKNLASQYSQFSHPLLENKRCNDIWSSTAQLPETNYSYLPREKFGQDMHSQGVIFNNVPFQGWQNHDNHDGTNHSHVIGSSIGSSVIPVNSVEQEGNLDYNYCDTLQMNQMKSQNSGISNNIGSLEDIVVGGMKQKQDKVKLMDGYYDNFSGGTSL